LSIPCCQRILWRLRFLSSGNAHVEIFGMNQILPGGHRPG